MAFQVIALMYAVDARTACAQDLSGSWRAGITTMDVKVESWGPNCGPKPASSRSAGGGIVELHMDGREVVIVSNGREIRTDRCWSRNPTIRRHSSRFLNRQWTTHCRTPKDDPREESGTYTLQLTTDNQLQYVDVSRYNWELNASRCIATIRTVQRMTKLPTELPAATATDIADAKSPPPKARCTPSIPTRITLRPAQAELELGEEQCLRARVFDALGCPVRSNQIRYSLSHSPSVRGELKGNCFRSSDNAAEGEGTFRVRATLNDLVAVATLNVHAMDLSALIAKRLEVGAVAPSAGRTTETPPVVPPAPKTRISAGGAVAETSASFPLTVALGGLAVMLLLASLWALRRRRPPDQSTSTQSPELPQPAPLPTPPPQATGPEDTWICPTCRRGQGASAVHCGYCSGPIALVPYAQFASLDGVRQNLLRCRTCGTDCEGGTRFCGECGGSDLVTRPTGEA